VSAQRANDTTRFIFSTADPPFYLKGVVGADATLFGKSSPGFRYSSRRVGAQLEVGIDTVGILEEDICAPQEGLFTTLWIAISCSCHASIARCEHSKCDENAIKHTVEVSTHSKDGVYPDQSPGGFE
jgi:hypothetical protein